MSCIPFQDMLRWAVSRFSAANIWYGHGTDNPWDEAVTAGAAVALPTAGYPGRYADCASDLQRETPHR